MWTFEEAINLVRIYLQIHTYRGNWKRLEKKAPLQARIRIQILWTSKRPCSTPMYAAYVNGVLENILETNIQEVVLTSCCDSVCRLYDVLKGRIQFVYHTRSSVEKRSVGVELFRKEIEEFIQILPSRLKRNLLTKKRVHKKFRTQKKKMGKTANTSLTIWTKR